MIKKESADYAVRGLELHSLYAWDYTWIMKVMDIMTKLEMNTLVLHRNDFVDAMVYPGKSFGYQAKDGDRSIFDVYGQIFRKVYQYTPTRRSCVYQKRVFLKRVLEQAKRRGFNVYIENKELYFPEILLEFYPELVHDGHVCATDPFWLDFLKEKYTEFFRDFPEVAGIITSPATGESKVSIKSNRCTCERCRSTSKEDWFRSILYAMYDVLHGAGKDLIIRDFVFDPKAQQEIATVMEQLPEDVIISLKNTPHDYYPTFPVNPRIGRVGHHRQWIEFDTMGQYYGWGLGVGNLMEDYRKRLKDAREKGATGAIFRLDWESLDGHTSFGTPNKLNVYSAGHLTRNLDTPSPDIYLDFLNSEGWISGGGNTDEGIRWFQSVMEKTWDVTSKTIFINGCVFSDSSVMPISVEHAVWLAEEKNSLKDWDPSKALSLSPVWTSVEAALSEKDDALEMAEALWERSKAYPKEICADKAQWLSSWMWMNREYVRMFRSAARSILLARYLQESNEIDEAYRAEKKKQLEQELAAMEVLEGDFRVFFNSTDYKPHIVYTLLDPDRIECLRRNIRRMNAGDA